MNIWCACCSSKKVPTAKPSSRRRRSAQSLPFLGGSTEAEILHRSKRQADAGESGDPVAEPSPGTDTSLLLHKVR
jgi:hypothetical protein